MKQYESFLELALSRYSVRSFDPRQIEEEKMNRILQAGQAAPTAANMQPQQIIVVQSEEALAAMRSVTPYTFKAPTIILMCADLRQAWRGADGFNSAHVDTAIVLTHMMLQAWDEGIGSCWVRGFDKRLMQQVFGLPDYLEPVSILPLGYPSEKAKPAKGWHDVRKDLKETVHFI